MAGTVDPTDLISRQSGLPAGEVQGMLANCDANQVSLNFCAWRDRVVAEQRLQDIVDDRVAKSPGCKARLDSKITALRKRRDASCKMSAEAVNGGGSIVLMEIAACQAAETDRMAKMIASARRCN
ncbi:lysozyme inhibitor LprI family protein [Paraburkholderia strydomiana]|uniref:lysozyme inhibitor LprI family protein n=1 Tax=Paraburkholderia strydomiana TaxID=1245417 RepID=UPI00286090EC|nr:lysozyme inhibitor LprI family protein [Paraburkholderia strydomiana]MDR7008863.1 hypothetical protein [Paraburkholderia strydomiana]